MSSAARERSELRTRSPAGANCKRRNCCTSDSLTFCDGADAAGVGDANAVVVVVAAVVDVVVVAAAVAVVVDRLRIDLSAVGELRQLQQLQTVGLIDAMLRPAINIKMKLQRKPFNVQGYQVANLLALFTKIGQFQEVLARRISSWPDTYFWPI